MKTLPLPVLPLALSLALPALAGYWGNPGSAFDPAKYPLRAHERRVASQEGASETATPPWLAWTGRPSLETVPAPGASASPAPARDGARRGPRPAPRRWRRPEGARP